MGSLFSATARQLPAHLAPLQHVPHEHPLQQDSAPAAQQLDASNYTPTNRSSDAAPRTEVSTSSPFLCIERPSYSTLNQTCGPSSRSTTQAADHTSEERRGFSRQRPIACTERNAHLRVHEMQPTAVDHVDCAGEGLMSGESEESGESSCSNATEVELSEERAYRPHVLLMEARYVRRVGNCSRSVTPARFPNRLTDLEPTLATSAWGHGLDKIGRPRTRTIHRLRAQMKLRRQRTAIGTAASPTAAPARKRRRKD